MNRNDVLFAAAQQHIPGGVNSPVRAFKGVGGTPVFFESGNGAYLTDANGKQYIDYVGSWGPMIAGHNHPAVKQALNAALENGLSFGAPTAGEGQLANKVCELMPNIDMVRLVNSGTEATMTALRLARAFTKRDKILKFTGCYHGHSDSLLVQAGSGALTLGVPSSPGVPECLAELTINAPFNDLSAVKEIFAQVGDEIAAIIVEPVAGNMGCILPKDGFLQGLRDVCDQYRSVLIFDEVMCGFRVALGGAQAVYNVKPDLTTLGKVIGGGMPIGAIGGSAAIMEMLAPLGPVYQAGTLSGNPIAVAAGIATLELITQANFYQDLHTKAEQLANGISEQANAAGVPLVVNQLGGMLSIFFTEQSKVSTFDEVQHCDIERFKKFFHSMLEGGIYLPPSAYESWFMSAAHEEKDIDKTITIMRQWLSTL